jgi:hypothetical protein|eukprot:COSAG01_NODE_8099_length_2918_cov_12.778959_2_plen_45_part_00
MTRGTHRIIRPAEACVAAAIAMPAQQSVTAIAIAGRCPVNDRQE